MNDKELLQAIKQIFLPLENGMKEMIKQTIAPLESDIKELKGDVSELKGDVSGLKSDVSELKRDMRDVKKKLTGVEGKLTNVEHEVVNTNLRIENDIWPAIQLIKEGYQGHIDKFKEHDRRIEENEKDIILLKMLDFQEHNAARLAKSKNS